MIECILVESDNFYDSKILRQMLDNITNGEYLVFSNLIRRKVINLGKDDKIKKLCLSFKTLLVYIEDPSLKERSDMRKFVDNEYLKNTFGFKAICIPKKAEEGFINHDYLHKVVIDHITKTYKLV